MGRGIPSCLAVSGRDSQTPRICGANPPVATEPRLRRPAGKPVGQAISEGTPFEGRPPIESSRKIRYVATEPRLRRPRVEPVGPGKRRIVLQRLQSPSASSCKRIAVGRWRTAGQRMITACSPWILKGDRRGRIDAERGGRGVPALAGCARARAALPLTFSEIMQSSCYARKNDHLGFRRLR